MRKNSNNETQLPLTISSKDGLVDQITFFNKTVASKDMSGYYLLKKGEYAYNKSYSVGYDFGSIKRLDRYPMGALSTLYICFELTKYNSDYVKTYFDSLKWYKEIYMISAEGARNHGLLNVPTDDFFNTYHYITENLDEQNKIANFMNLIEERIEKQQELINNLKKYKRGVIQSIFNQKFNLNNSWTSTKLGNVFSERNERATGSEELLSVTISNGVQKRHEIDAKDNSSEDKSNYKKVKVGDIAYNTMRMWQGASGASPYEGIVSPAYTVITLNDLENQNYEFWAYYFKHIPLIQKFQKYSQGLTSDTWNLKYPQFAEISVSFPPKKDQDKFVAFLKTIDKKCSYEDSILMELMEYRKQLLQRLFI